MNVCENCGTTGSCKCTWNDRSQAQDRRERRQREQDMNEGRPIGDDKTTASWWNGRRASFKS